MENTVNTNEKYHPMKRNTDFLTGLFGGIGYLIVVVVAIFNIRPLFEFWWIFVLGYITTVILSVYFKRYYIALGLVALLGVLLLVLGGCFGMVLNMH
jgi:hypothetical protein